MKKNQREQERARSAYVPPLIEVCGAAPTQLMGTSFYSDGHTPGDERYDDSDHTPGNVSPVEYGAKTVILGQEFSFSNPWED